MSVITMIRKLISNKLYSISINSHVFIVQPVLNNCARNAGHSHWQNVKSTKEMKDKIKNNNVRIISVLVQNSIKAGNGVRDPKINSHLAAAINRARELSIPMSSIENLLSKTDTIDPYLIEFQAPGGIFLIIESCSKHTIRERHSIQAIIKKYGFKPVSGSILNKVFHHKAEIVCKANKDHLSDCDKALELALEVGAEEVVKEKDGETGEDIYKFTCQPNEMQKVKEALSEKSVFVNYSSDYYDALTKVEINEEMKSLVSEMSNKLYDELETVQRIFINTTK